MDKPVENRPGSGLDEALAGGGEMGALMRATDWSATPLGPVSDWPQSLRTAVSICLNSRFPILVWWGPELLMLYNDAYRPILGQEKHPEALGKAGRAIWPEIWDIIGPMLEGTVMTEGQATYSEDQLLVLHRNGYPEECYFTFSYSPIRDESGSIGGVFTAVTETTEKVLSERRLRTLRELGTQSLGEESSAGLCRVMAAVLADNPYDFPFAAIYLVESGSEGARLAATTGIDAGTPAAPESVALKDMAERDPWQLALVARGEEGFAVNDVPEYLGSLPGGAWPDPPRQVVTLAVILPAHRQPTAILVAGVSARRALGSEYRTFFGLVAGQIASALSVALAYEEERRRAEALAEIDRAKTTFFSNVSHELRTPLTLLLAPLENTLGEEKLPEEDRAALRMAHRNALRLLKLVNTLLDFSRIEAGRAEASFEPVDLAAYTAELASWFRSAIEKAGLRFTVDCRPLPEPVYVDREMWEKIVLNLLSNALKFTLKGEIEISLHPHNPESEAFSNPESGTRNPQSVVLRVRDTGVGIPATELPRIFERFHRVQGAEGRTHEGTGIGLALVRELAHIQGGEVNVESTPGEGTTFTVTLPMGKSHLPKDHIERVRKLASTSVGAAPFIEEALRWLPEEGLKVGEREPVSSNFQPPTAPARLLLADDNADMRGYLRRLLSERYVVEAVADGRAALEAARERTPDLVLTDVMMPGLDGFELLKALREDVRTQELPVVLLSARAGEEARIEGLEAGADDYLVKPFSARELLARIEAQLNLARLRRAATLRDREHAEQLREMNTTLEQRVQQRTTELKQTNTVLEQKNHELQDFAYVASHDLQEPLRKITTFADLLRADGGTRLDAQSSFYLERIQNAAGRMSDLIADLLAYSRVMTQGRPFQPVDLNGVVDDVIHDLDLLIEETGACVEAGKLPVIDADGAQMRRLLHNLVENAIKFRDPNRPPVVQIEADVEEGTHAGNGRTGEVCRLIIRDNGTGFEQRFAERIFAPFQRLHGRSAYKGTGMGLAIVRRIIERHHGSITADSTPGEGTTFTIILPMHQKAQAETLRESSEMATQA